MHFHRFLNRKNQLFLLLPLILLPLVLGVNALALMQMVRIDLQGQLVEMGYLSEENDGADLFIIPPRKPDFSLRFSHKEA